MAARCRIAAGEKIVLSFGARRMHPALSPMIDRSAFIGGCDGVSVIKSAEILGEEPKGTMPHALILIVGDPVKAYKLFHKFEPKEIKRVALIDTFGDEKFEALDAAKAIGGDLFAVRLDTPGSRRGNFREILEEVRWELDLKGYKDVKLFASGGLNEYSILELQDIVDAFGVGTSLSNAPVIDFSMDIVEVEGEPIAKRGKLSGRKMVMRCKGCNATKVVPWGWDGLCDCGQRMEDLLILFIKEGALTSKLPSPREIREFVISQIKGMGLSLG
jgi:nicotinate phosphoribosyltransferase